MQSCIRAGMFQALEHGMLPLSDLHAPWVNWGAFPFPIANELR